MSKYWSSVIRKLAPYVPGEQPKDRKFIKLNTNENPYAPSPRVLDAIRSLTDESLRLYPDPNCEALKIALAEYYHVDMQNVFVGNGSDEVLALSFLGFFKQAQPILFPDITYSFFEVYCGFFEIERIRIPLTDTFEISLNDYGRANGGIIFANPNAPTGRFIPLDKIEALLRENEETVVIVDEAYIDFGGESAVKLIKTYPNLLVTQTFSKSRSLAGLRVGMAFGSAELVDGLERAKNSFNSYPLDRLALNAAVEAVNDQAYFRAICQKVIHTRERTVTVLEDLDFEVMPSKTNFIFVRHATIKARELFRKLRAKGILVRYFDKPRIENYLRITIGTDAEMDALMEALGQLV